MEMGCWARGLLSMGSLFSCISPNGITRRHSLCFCVACSASPSCGRNKMQPGESAGLNIAVGINLLLFFDLLCTSCDI